jgi:curved DNA-binding protein CbpA
LKKQLPYSGNIKKYSLHYILAYLNKKRIRGILTLKHEDIKKDIYVEDGYVVCASSNQDNERLGVLLVKEGKITTEQRDESLELSKKTGKRQGIILVERGYILPKDLFDALKTQIKEIIYSLFLLENGIYEFREVKSFSDVIKIKVNIDTLIREGLAKKEMIAREKEKSFMETVHSYYDKLTNKTLSYYDILSLNVKASLSDVKQAYLRVAKQFHPDMHVYLPHESREKLKALFTYLNKAYETLSDELKRKKYDNKLLKGKTGTEPKKTSFNVEENFKRGVVEYKKGNFWGAADIFREVTRKAPDKALHWAYLSLALSNMQNRIKEAEETILKAIELEPHNANYFVHLGEIYIKAGMKKRAIRQFEIALKWDPTNKRVQKELEKLKSIK